MSFWIGKTGGAKLFRYLRDETVGIEKLAIFNCTLLGKGAKRQGLYGQDATQAVWDNLRRGFAQDGKTKLVRNAGSRKRQQAWLGVLGVPKPVSALLGLLPEAERKKLVAATVKAAVAEVVKPIEAKHAFARTGAGGKTPVRCELAWIPTGASVNYLS